MSSYANYDLSSRHYDRTRLPIGSEIIIGCLAGQAKPLNRQVVLDAGCGTGAYTQAIADRVGRVVALDVNRRMLEIARAKCRPAGGRIGFHQASIAELPLDAASVDAVMINQVLHHLPDKAAAGFPAHRRVIAECARVLRPGGALLINSCSHAQLRDGCWYSGLVPRAAKAMRRRFAPLEVVRRLLQETGFVYRGGFVPVDALCQGEAYFDGLGPLSKAWRDGDSLWALAGDAELDRACARIRDLDAAGVLKAFVAKHDARRRQVGQITFSFAIRA